MGLVCNHYISLMNSELTRFQDTVILLKDYYTAMQSGMTESHYDLTIHCTSSILSIIKQLKSQLLLFSIFISYYLHFFELRVCIVQHSHTLWHTLCEGRGCTRLECALY